MEFDQIDWIIATLHAAEGMEWARKQNGAIIPFDEERYLRYVIARYQAFPNVDAKPRVCFAQNQLLEEVLLRRFSPAERLGPGSCVGAHQK